MGIKRISSRENAWFKRLRRAAERHEEEIVVEGRKQIADALRAGLEPIALVASDESLLDFAAIDSVQLVVSEELLGNISATATPQGIVALCQRPLTRLPDLPPTTSRFLVLDRIQDPGNVGTLIRLAAAFRCEAVIATSGTADPFSAKSLRAAVGTTFLLPIIRCTTDEAITFFRKRKIPMLGADAHAAIDLRDAQVDGTFALVFGSEGEGLSEEFLQTAELYRIETDPRVESLNVAAAAAIFLWRVMG
jgi:TrmH family RNA methyltransferase